MSNYLAKYLTKQSNLGYNKKRFMHTRNLLNKTKTTLFLSDEEFEAFCEANGLYLSEDKERFKVFRNYGEFAPTVRGGNEGT